MIWIDVAFQEVKSPRRITCAIKLVRNTADLARNDALSNRILNLIQWKKSREPLQSFWQNLVSFGNGDDDFAVPSKVASDFDLD